MIKVISLDIGGTLVEKKSKDYSKYNLTALSNIVKVPYSDVRKAYKDVFQKTKGNKNELINNFCNILNINRNIQIDNFFSNKFKSSNGYISQDKIDVIKKLKQLKYKIILFSNNCCLFKSDIEEYKYLFDEVFYSFNIGYTKNEVESYEYIESKMNYQPGEFLHIGDTLISDYKCPKENGWNALYYGVCNDPKVKSIKSLQEIFNYLL